MNTNYEDYYFIQENLEMAQEPIEYQGSYYTEREVDNACHDE